MMQPGIAILGPTCSGKSAVAMALAGAFPAEIIGCDSMQVYAGMEIGTAAPCRADRDRIPHHLTGLLDIHERFDVQRFVDLSERLVAEIRGRGATPLLVGGTGLYAKALLYGFDLLPASPAVLAEIQEEADQPGGRDRLIAELQTAAGCPPPADVLANNRRLTRAVEILRLGGQPPWQKPAAPPIPRPDFRQYLLLPEMGLLRPRIAQRTRWMLEHGWIEETRRLLAQGLLHTPTARQALGYRDIAAHLGGKAQPTLPQLEIALVQRTVAYARRQRTWFRSQHPGAVLMPFADALAPETLAAAILRDQADHPDPPCTTRILHIDPSTSC